MKKHKILLVTTIIILSITLLILSFAQYIVKDFIIDAAVDDGTGLISFLTQEYELKTYDCFGTLMYQTKLTNTDGGYALLDYTNGFLIVQILRTNDIYVYNNDGTIYSKYSSSKNPIHSSWDNWSRNNTGYFYETSTHTYSYTYPYYLNYLFVHSNIEIKITNKDTQQDIIVWK